MSLIAGIVSRKKGQPVPGSACDRLRQLISRNASDEVSVFKDERSYLLKVDIGAYRERGYKVDETGALTLLAGEPLLSREGQTSWQSREDDLALIHDHCLRCDDSILKSAQGVFAAVHYQPESATLRLVADKLGIRPLYYWVDENYVAFASALRILENLPEIPKKMDVRAVTEMIAYSVPLGDRTPYANIFILKPAEIVEVAGPKVSRRRYWRLDTTEISRASEMELVRHVYDCFQQAVARRNRNDTTTVAYLSGGLDSRCVVGALAAQGVRVHTFNFARPGTQDQFFGDDFAVQMGTIHENLPKEPGDRVPDYSSIMANAWGVSRHRREWPPERPALVWSGEGGSVALGHVHMNEMIVELLRAGKDDAAIEEFCRRESIYFPAKLFKPQAKAALEEVIKEGVREELRDLDCEDAGRRFYLFLMLNEQRRKLVSHFENLDLHRLEFQLPFLDSAFLASIVSVPIDLCLRHKFYGKWLRHFDDKLTTVPWQAYPGHEPCPLPVPEGLAYQWAEGYLAAERATQKRLLLNRANTLLRATDFPEKILSRRNLRLATWIHSTGWRDYEYLIAAAETYHDYWKKCGGEYALVSR